MATVDSAAAPRFSILLPTHNRADLLPFAIRSVLAQTLGDFELLIVGDGCTDNTAEVVRSFSDPRVRFFDLPKAPHFGYANRNIVLRQARGSLIAYMAHDDLWLHDHLEKLAPLFSTDHVDLAYSCPLWVLPKGLIAPGTFNLHSPAALKSFLDRKRNQIPSPCVMHRRSCFEKVGYWNEALPRCGDWDLWARIIEGGGRNNFAYLVEGTCLHFRADWRNNPVLIGDNEKVWAIFHAFDGFMPAALKIPVHDGLSEQESAWRAMSDNPADWSRTCRAAIQQAVDQRLAQSDDLIRSLSVRDRHLQTVDIQNNFQDLILAWKPPYILRKIIGLNNRLRRFRKNRASPNAGP